LVADPVDAAPARLALTTIATIGGKDFAEIFAGDLQKLVISEYVQLNDCLSLGF
jgi:hypothetical protein